MTCCCPTRRTPSCPLRWALHRYMCYREAKGILHMTVFTEGITNVLVGCHLGDFKDVVLVRIYGEKTEIIIDRDVEKRNMKLLEQHGCAKSLYCAFKNGLAYGFIPGRTLDEKSVREDHIGSLIAKEMVNFHALQVPELKDSNITPTVFRTMRKWLKVIPAEFPEPERNERLKMEVPDSKRLLVEIETLEKAAEYVNSPLVFSHNDLLLKNIIITEENDRAYFIDYEYGGVNPEAYDISNHFCEYAGIDEVNYELYPDEEYQKKWLRRFLEYKFQHVKRQDVVTEKDVQTLYVQTNQLALASHLFWGIWGLVQARYSTINFDYLDYAIVRMNEYFRCKDKFLSLKMPE
ncbi:ethanolamine kinase 1-like isoform X2 [Lineus longissimus]|uniref:ethanolamine kinase 1-like isoform X2 n=1 Tax=Lineus longissimus TaxID=88925 RepID=UPI00315D5209